VKGKFFSDASLLALDFFPFRMASLGSDAPASGGDADGMPDIPPALPAICAAISCCVSGLTSFGDAITFHIVWAIATAMGLAPPGRVSLAKAVIFVTVMSLANMPLFI
jgi:hypothetical protein